MPEYATIQQHQPLRVPQSFDRQGKALVLQLDEVFDDIYRRFGRLRLADMGKEFRKQIADDEGNIADLQFDLTGLTARVETAEGNITTITADVSGLTTRVSTAEGDIGALEVRAGNIEISVANKYDKVSGIAIESAGVTISGSKYVKIQSGCSLQLSTGGTFTIESGKFSIDANGNVYVNGSGYFSGELVAATGTFTGTMSAACITSGTMSADRISGGTLVLGGNGNVNGSLSILDSSGNIIGGWDKDSFSISTSSSAFEVDSANLLIDSEYGYLKTRSVISNKTCGFMLGDTRYDLEYEDIKARIRPTGGLINDKNYYFMEIEFVDNGTFDTNNRIITSLYVGTTAVYKNGITTFVPMISGGGWDYHDNKFYDHGNIDFTNAWLYHVYSSTIECATFYGGEINGTYKIVMMPSGSASGNRSITMLQTSLANNRKRITISSDADEFLFSGNADTATRLSQRPTYGQLSGRS